MPPRLLGYVLDMIYFVSPLYSVTSPDMSKCGGMGRGTHIVNQLKKMYFGNMEVILTMFTTIPIWRAPGVGGYGATRLHVWGGRDHAPVCNHF